MCFLFKGGQSIIITATIFHLPEVNGRIFQQFSVTVPHAVVTHAATETLLSGYLHIRGLVGVVNVVDKWSEMKFFHSIGFDKGEVKLKNTRLDSE